MSNIKGVLTVVAIAGGIILLGVLAIVVTAIEVAGKVNIARAMGWLP